MKGVGLQSVIPAPYIDPEVSSIRIVSGIGAVTPQKAVCNKEKWEL